MNTAIYSTSGQSAGIGFAVPIDTVKVVVQRIISSGGKYERPSPGVQVMGGNQARALFGIQRGLAVVAVSPGSGAEAAGLRPALRSLFSTVSLGDVILECNGRKLSTEADFLQSYDLKNPGDVISLKVLRYPSASGDKGNKAPIEVDLKLKLQKANPIENAPLPASRRR